MTLSEFLATADVDHSTALTQAKSYEESQGNIVTSNVLTMLLVGAGLYGYFRDCSVDTQHPARGICLALMDRLRTQSEFNFIQGHPKGSVNNDMIDLLINVLMTEKQAELEALRTSLNTESSTARKPFEQVTLYDVLVARGACPAIPVTASGGYVVINILSDVEPHNPQVYATNPRTNKPERVNGFRSVGKAGLYECIIPTQWRTSQLSVDNAYDVIESQ
jgi:hypothetical protein